MLWERKTNEEEDKGKNVVVQKVGDLHVGNLLGAEALMC